MRAIISGLLRWLHCLKHSEKRTTFVKAVQDPRLKPLLLNEWVSYQGGDAIDLKRRMLTLKNNISSPYKKYYAARFENDLVKNEQLSKINNFYHKY